MRKGPVADPATSFLQLAISFVAPTSNVVNSPRGLIERGTEQPVVIWLLSIGLSPPLSYFSGSVFWPLIKMVL